MQPQCATPLPHSEKDVSQVQFSYTLPALAARLFSYVVMVLHDEKNASVREMNSFNSSCSWKQTCHFDDCEHLQSAIQTLVADIDIGYSCNCSCLLLHGFFCSTRPAVIDLTNDIVSSSCVASIMYCREYFKTLFSYRYFKYWHLVF